MAKRLQGHRDLLLHWFHAKVRIASGAVKGFNDKAKVTTKKAYRFRGYDLLELALRQTRGDLPDAEFTHEFC